MTSHIWDKKYPPSVDWDAELPARPLYALMDDAVARHGGKSAIDFLDRKFSYAEVGEMIEHAACGFQELGVGPGVKVGLFLPNCPQFIVCYYGVLKAGGTVVNFSPLYSEGELLDQIEDSQTEIMVTLNLKVLYPKMKAMLGQSSLKKLVVGTIAEVLPFLKSKLYPFAKSKDIANVPNDAQHISFKELLHNDGKYDPPAIDPNDDVAVLQYTGGTTGVSKGAMLTHGNLYINTMQARLWFTEMKDGKERMMGVLPFFHVFAMTVVMNYSISVGAEIIIHPRFDLVPVLKDINNKKPTLMPGVPTMFQAINTYPKLADYDLTSIKACISGGAPLPSKRCLTSSGRGAPDVG